MTLLLESLHSKRAAIAVTADELPSAPLLLPDERYLDEPHRFLSLNQNQNSPVAIAGSKHPGGLYAGRILLSRYVRLWLLTCGLTPSIRSHMQTGMRHFLALAAVVLVCCAPTANAAEERLFELRTYYAAPGKLDDLLARFRNHTTRLFEKHGIQNIGYWVPVNNPEQKLVYLVAFPNKEAREKSFQEFGADPEWQKAAKASEENGRLVTKIDSLLLRATDFSPAVIPSSAHPPRLYELRIYKAAEGKLGALQARFRDHTSGLFAKHGMTQLGYFTPVEAKDGSADTLVYLLAHKDQDAMNSSFKAFRADPKWIKAKTDSETDGPLTVQEGVKSVPLTPVDFSAAK